MNGTCKLIIKLRRLALSEHGGALAELAIMVPFLAVMLAVSPVGWETV